MFECEVDIFRGVIKMFLTGYQTDFGGYLTHFCTHTHSKETEDLSAKPCEQDKSVFTSNNKIIFSRNNSRGTLKLWPSNQKTNIYESRSSGYRFYPTIFWLFNFLLFYFCYSFAPGEVAGNSKFYHFCSNMHWPVQIFDYLQLQREKYILNTLYQTNVIFHNII